MLKKNWKLPKLFSKGLTLDKAALKKKASGIWGEYSYLTLCTLIPALLILLIYFARGHYPIANSSVLVLDLNGQYVWFFEALRNFARGDAELLYSFARSMGGDFLGIYAYYLASPLSYLVCLFPTERMLEALLALFTVKTALCGFTFGFYMHKTEKLRNKLATILFSTFYALSAYAVVQQHNTMWIDAVMWLPLITLGIESVIKYGKFKLFVVSFSIALFSNFYIGYMLCIYCAAYFFIYYFAHAEDHRNNPLREKYHFWRSLIRIVLYAALSLGIAAFIILGAYYSLNFGKSTFTNPNWDWKTNFDIIDFLYKLLPGSYDTVRPAGLPFVYCGVLTLLLIPSYFLSKRFSMRQKIFSAILILFFFASFVFSVPDLIWHVFQKPVWLNHRYSFMLTFYLCVLACRAFSDTEELSLRVTATTGGFIALLCVILQKYTSGDYVDPDDYTCIYFTLILVFAYLATLAIFKKTLNRQVVAVTLVCIVAIETFLNGLFCLDALGSDVGYSGYSYYNNFLKKTRPIVQAVQTADTSFYRMEKSFFRKTNDNMALNIRGLSGSTSTLNKETIQILNKMGYASKSHWSKYLGGTPVNDSLLGLKYIISDNDVYLDYYDVYRTDPVNGYTAYLNPDALSIAYAVNEDVLTFPLGYRAPTDESANTQKGGNGITSAVSAVKSFLNDLLGIEEMKGTYYEDAYYSPFERLNAMVSSMLGEEETLQIFVPVEYTDSYTDNLRKGGFSGTENGYLFIDDNADPAKEKGVVTFTVQMPTDGELYFYAPTSYVREVKLTLEAGDDVEEKPENIFESAAPSKAQNWGTFNGNETTRIISLDSHKAGDTVKLNLQLTKNAFYLRRVPCFYYIDWAVFEDAMARLADNQLNITSYTESSFEGTLKATSSDEIVMTSLAYDKGWQVYVDGEQVEVEKAFGAFLSFRVNGNEGATHSISMVYRPKAFVVGGIISGCSIILFVLLIFLERKHFLGCRDNRTDEERANDEAEEAKYEIDTTEPSVSPVSVTIPSHISKLKSSETEHPARFKILSSQHRNRKDD